MRHAAALPARPRKHCQQVRQTSFSRHLILKADHLTTTGSGQISEMLRVVGGFLRSNNDCGAKAKPSRCDTPRFRWQQLFDFEKQNTNGLRQAWGRLESKLFVEKGELNLSLLLMLLLLVFLLCFAARVRRFAGTTSSSI